MSKKYSAILFTIAILFSCIVYGQVKKESEIIDMQVTTIEVSNINKSKSFYEDILGFECRSYYKPTQWQSYKFTGKTFFAIMENQHLLREKSLDEIDFFVMDVEKLWANVKDKVSVKDSLAKTPWGSHKFVIRDPDGYLLGFIQKKETVPTIKEIKMINGIEVLFVAGFGPIVQDDSESQKLYIETLNLPLKKGNNNYCHTEELSGVKAFALWPLSQAALSCFGNKNWPQDIPLPQAWLEFDVKDIVKATEVIKTKGYKLLVSDRKEPWGQTVTRFLSPEGILIGLTYTPWMRGENKQ
jgi:catechol 2,3-dioxygenase-like lactoylglutathione lyase family enzyme